MDISAYTVTCIKSAKPDSVENIRGQIPLQIFTRTNLERQWILYPDFHFESMAVYCNEQIHHL